MSDRLEIRYIPITQAVLWDRNPKEHDIGKLVTSIWRHGFKDPPHYDGALEAFDYGNGRTTALIAGLAAGRHIPKGCFESDGEIMMPVTFGVDADSKAAAEAFAIDHNNLTMLGGDFMQYEISKMWVEEEYVAMLKGLADADELPVSVDGDDLDALLRDVMVEDETPGEDAEAKVDQAEELRKKWQVELGQLWELGEHRLICGDCTDAAVVERVMAGDSANLCFTSPPYSEQRKKQYGGLHEDDYWTWFDMVQDSIKGALDVTGHFVLNIKPHTRMGQRSLYVFDLVLSMVRKRGWRFVDEFCWLRTGVPGQVIKSFKNAFEPCYWFALSDEFLWYPRQVMHHSESVPLPLGPGAGSNSWADRQGQGGGAILSNLIMPGLAYPSNVLDFKNNAEALGHPAAFPLQLPSFFVKCMTQDGGVLFDPFVGSGTTLIACENLSRRCRAIEISPAYVAVALQRWADTTGGTPKLISNNGEVTRG
ncbi:MAG: site-specific DNA-methyltransferase [Planctomycetaceae bacterium]|nr:site-specific DNA-methyltransferase [Planctomycetaceae bacterium]